jgi:hypothetical protein
MHDRELFCRFTAPLAAANIPHLRLMNLDGIWRAVLAGVLPDPGS